MSQGADKKTLNRRLDCLMNQLWPQDPLQERKRQRRLTTEINGGNQKARLKMQTIVVDSDSESSLPEESSSSAYQTEASFIKKQFG